MKIEGIPGQYGLENHGLKNIRTVYWNLFPSALVEKVILRNEGRLAGSGSVVVSTGQFTGRSPNDKFVVQDPALGNDTIWWGKVNQPISPLKYQQIYHKMLAYLQGRDVFVQDLAAGAYPSYRVPIRVISTCAWASLFARNLFIRSEPEQITQHVPNFLVLHCPDFKANPKEDGVNSSTFVLVNFIERTVLIGGTGYAGEIKKSIFTVLNYLYPRQDILSMHCSANMGANGDVALFFGLSGTGKTTLSSNSERGLIGDDEHGWSDEGIFNFEGGCYAKTIRLRQELEPLIWEACHRFGTVLENVMIDPVTGGIDFDSDQLTENTRAAYPLDYVPNYVKDGYGRQPENIFFLTADAFGVLPPISRLTLEQAVYYFLSGYTAKIAGTERGLGAEPVATFSTCFGAPFLPLRPLVYANLLGKKIARHNVRVWLVNTGWTGGPYGIGARIRLPYTRAMIQTALDGKIDENVLCKDDLFGLQVPCHVEGVPDEILRPQDTWADKEAYRVKALDLIARFEKNFSQFEGEVSANIKAAGPHLQVA